MGLDTFYEIPTWKDIRNFFAVTNFIVTSRPGYRMEGIRRVLESPAFQGLSFFESREGTAGGQRSFKEKNAPYSIFILETTPVTVSSTEIRERIGQGKDVSEWLPQEVEKYILENGIYKMEKGINGS